MCAWRCSTLFKQRTAVCCVGDYWIPQGNQRMGAHGRERRIWSLSIKRMENQEYLMYIVELSHWNMFERKHFILILSEGWPYSANFRKFFKLGWAPVHWGGSYFDEIGNFKFCMLWSCSQISELFIFALGPFLCQTPLAPPPFGLFFPREKNWPIIFFENEPNFTLGPI